MFFVDILKPEVTGNYITATEASAFFRSQIVLISNKNITERNTFLGQLPRAYLQNHLQNRYFSGKSQKSQKCHEKSICLM